MNTGRGFFPDGSHQVGYAGNSYEVQQQRMESVEGRIQSMRWAHAEPSRIYTKPFELVFKSKLQKLSEGTNGNV